MSKLDTVEWDATDSGYDSTVTTYTIQRKFQGTDPDITLTCANSKRGAEFKMSVENAKKLIKALTYLVGNGTY